MSSSHRFYLNFLILLSLIVLPVFSDQIVIASDIYLPWNGNPDSELPGYMIEIAQKIFNNAGHTLEYRLMPWARSIEEAEHNTINGIIGAFYEDAPGFIFPINEQSLSLMTFYVQKDNPW